MSGPDGGGRSGRRFDRLPDIDVLSRTRIVLVLVVLGVLAGGIVGTAAVGVGPAADLLEDDDDRMTTDVGDGDRTVFLEPADSPEGDAYAELDGDGDLAVEVDGLAPRSLTQVDDIFRVGFGADSPGDPDPPENETALIALNATGPLDDDPDADVTFIDMRTGEVIAESGDNIEEDGLELAFGERANVGVIVDSATSDQVSTEVRVIVDEPGVADFTVELELDTPGDRTRANETIVGETVIALSNVTNAGDREDTKPVVLRVDGQQVDQDAVFVEPGQSVVEELFYETDTDDVPEGTAEDFLEFEVETDNDIATADVLVLAEIHRYTSPETRIVTTGGLFDAIDDWRNDRITTLLLFDVIDALRLDEPIPPSGDIPDN